MLQQFSLLLLLLPLLASATCPSGPEDCVIRDARMSGAELFNSRLSDSTRRLSLINVNFTSWPEDAATPRRATQLESLTLNGVFGTVSVSGVMTSLVRLSLINCCPLADGGGVHSLDRLAELSLVGGCKIDALNSTWLGRLPSLRNLTIDSARVDSLLLADLPVETRGALQEITVKNCNFNKLGNDAFGSMPNLRSLVLDGNIVQYIQPGAFAGLRQLRELSIVLPFSMEGKLPKIWEPLLDGRFNSNTELQTLRLVNARLAEEQIPNALDPLRNLRRLDLSGHRFRNLSNSVLASLTGLRELDLSHGSLKCLFDRNFGIMKWLERLSLANNEIRVIGQRALLGLTSLTSLDLSGNPIEEIQRGAFCSLPSAVKDSPDLLAGFNGSAVLGAANLSEPCPPGFDPNRLVLSSRPQCLLPKPRYGSGDHAGDGKSSTGSQSRHTFLIIIGLCVAFLLITIISMMAYKGWSKRKNAQLARDEEKELELQAMVAAAEAPPTNSDSNGGKKPPHNGRHQQQQHQRHHTAGKSSGSKSSAKKSPTTPSAAEAAADEGDGGAAEVEVTKAQVESPEKSSNPSESTTPKGVESPTASQNLPSPSAKDAAKAQPPQLRPGVTLMTSVPEDSDLEARAITTLVVV